jgi:hypothetical protein
MKTSLLPLFPEDRKRNSKGLIMSGGVAYVVQDLESYMFLCEQDGDVGYTPCLHVLARFETWEEALRPDAWS